MQRISVVVPDNTSNTFQLVEALAKGAARTATSDVEEGAVVKAVYLEYWINGKMDDGTAQIIIYKRPAGVAGPTNAEMSNLAAYANKKNIFEMHQGLAPAGGNVVPMFRHWIKIPKGKQRFGLGDLLDVKISAVGSDLQICGFCTYKEYN